MLLYRIADFDNWEDKYISMCMHNMGDIKMKEAETEFKRLWLQERKIHFAESIPADKRIKFLVKEFAVSFMYKDCMNPQKRNVCMVGNNTAIVRVFSERIAKKYDLMFSQKAFVHWYIGEGMEEDEFIKAREDMGLWEKDYYDVLLEDDSDEDASETND